MTNQPRSSRVAAAVERPAPDIPVTTTNSLIASPVLRPPALRIASYTARPTSSGSQDRARSSSSDAARTALTPPSSLTRRALRAGPRPGDVVEDAARSSACRAARGGR